MSFGNKNIGIDVIAKPIPMIKKPSHQAPIKRGSFLGILTVTVNEKNVN